MSVYKNLPICDLRGLSIEAAKAVEGIKNAAVVIFPNDADPELESALRSIPMVNVVKTINLGKEGKLRMFNGITELSEQDFNSRRDVLMVNGIAILHEVPESASGDMIVNGMLVCSKKIQKQAQLSLEVNGVRQNMDFDHCHIFGEKIKVDHDLLELVEEKTLIAAEETVEIAPDVTMDMLKEKKPVFVSGEKVVCSKEIAAYAKLFSVVGEQVCIAGEDGDDEDEDWWD